MRERANSTKNAKMASISPSNPSSQTKIEVELKNVNGKMP